MLPSPPGRRCEINEYVRRAVMCLSRTPTVWRSAASRVLGRSNARGPSRACRPWARVERGAVVEYVPRPSEAPKQAQSRVSPGSPRRFSFLPHGRHQFAAHFPSSFAIQDSRKCRVLTRAQTRGRAEDCATINRPVRPLVSPARMYRPRRLQSMRIVSTRRADPILGKDGAPQACTALRWGERSDTSCAHETPGDRLCLQDGDR